VSSWAESWRHAVVVVVVVAVVAAAVAAAAVVRGTADLTPSAVALIR